jgi:hypothetical protein
MTIDVPGPATGRGARWRAALRQALDAQEQLWDRYLSSAGQSGLEARAVLGEPPLRWAGGRLRGSVLTDRS